MEVSKLFHNKHKIIQALRGHVVATTKYCHCNTKATRQYFLNEYGCILFFLCLCPPAPSCIPAWHVGSWPGIKPTSPAVEAWSLNQWTAREVSIWLHSNETIIDTEICNSRNFHIIKVFYFFLPFKNKNHFPSWAIQKQVQGGFSP